MPKSNTNSKNGGDFFIGSVEPLYRTEGFWHLVKEKKRKKKNRKSKANLGEGTFALGRLLLPGRFAESKNKGGPPTTQFTLSPLYFE